jgi:hypothetical protein
LTETLYERKVINETVGKPVLLIIQGIKGFHVCDARHALLKYLAGHKLKKVMKVITRVMMLRLLLVKTNTMKTCILCCYDGWLRPEFCTKEKDETSCKLCIDRGLTRCMEFRN